MTTLLGSLMEVAGITDAVITKEVTKSKAAKSATIVESAETLASNCGKLWLSGVKVQDSINALEVEAQNILKEVNRIIKNLHDSGVTVGKSRRSCKVATAFFNALGDGLKETTKANYLSRFRTCVNEGSAIVNWNKAHEEVKETKEAEAKEEPQGTKHKIAKGENEVFTEKLLSVFNLDGGEKLKALCFQIEEKYENAEVDSFYEGIVDFLKSEGVEL